MEVRILVAFLSCLLVTERSAGQNAVNTVEPVVVEDTTTTEAAVNEVENAAVNLGNPAIERSGYAHAHVHTDHSFKGFWSKKIAWRPRWVKTWQEKKVYVAVWKRMWGPLVVKEWVPVPKPPPGWVKHDTASYIVKKYPYHY